MDFELFTYFLQAYPIENVPKGAKLVGVLEWVPNETAPIEIYKDLEGNYLARRQET